MASNQRPVFIPPKKRAAKKGGDAGSVVPRRIQSYDIITSIPNEGYMIKSQPDVRIAGFSPEKRMPEKHPRRNLSKSKDELDYIAEATTDSTKTPTTTKDAEKSLLKSSLQDSADYDAIVTEMDVPVTECTALKERSKPFAGGPTINVENVDTDIESATEKSALKDGVDGEENYITMTGTIKRGKKAGQCVGVRLNMSREELEDMEASIISHKPDAKQRMWTIRSGIHILFWSIICAPVVLVFASVYSFYIGTLTWYNVYLHYSEERTIWHKISMCPLLILTYPFLIVLASIGLGVYATAVQMAWNYDLWLAEVLDLEKGFYGWLCAVLGLDDCAPYEVVILSEVAQDGKVKRRVVDTAL